MQKTAYEMRIRDWSAYVFSSDLDVLGQYADQIGWAGHLSQRWRLAERSNRDGAALDRRGAKRRDRQGCQADRAGGQQAAQSAMAPESTEVHGSVSSGGQQHTVADRSR